MDMLYKLGLEEKEIYEMIERCKDIKDLTEEEIEQKILLLKKLDCNERHIRNIIVSNPDYLNRTNSDVIKLINKLFILDFDCINILLDSNPYILNKDDFEVECYIKNRLENGEELEDIVDDLNSNPILFDEM